MIVHGTRKMRKIEQERKRKVKRARKIKSEIFIQVNEKGERDKELLCEKLRLYRW